MDKVFTTLLTNSELTTLLSVPEFNKLLYECRQLYDGKGTEHKVRMPDLSTVLILPDQSGHVAKCETV